MPAPRMLFVLVPLALAACTKTVDTKGFEKTIEERVRAIGLVPESVSCPSGVAPKTGAKFTCKITIENTSYDLDVTITTVKDKDVAMDTSWAKGHAVVRRKIVDNLPAELGKQLHATVTIDCGKDALVFLTGNQLDCSLTSGTTTSKLTLTFDEKYNMTEWKLDPPLPPTTTD